ncbi:hypothetical protein DFH05DRAFT_1363835, partial [Lentinula detonsa]
FFPFLTQPDQVGLRSFHIAALSLSDFAFSKAPKQQSFDLTQYGEVRLQQSHVVLGQNLVTQGGDRRFYTTRRIAQLSGHKHCKAWHTNYP